MRIIKQELKKRKPHINAGNIETRINGSIDDAWEETLTYIKWRKSENGINFQFEYKQYVIEKGKIKSYDDFDDWEDEFNFLTVFFENYDTNEQSQFFISKDRSNHSLSIMHLFLQVLSDELSGKLDWALNTTFSLRDILSLDFNFPEIHVDYPRRIDSLGYSVELKENKELDEFLLRNRIKGTFWGIISTSWEKAEQDTWKLIRKYNNGHFLQLVSKKLEKRKGSEFQDVEFKDTNPEAYIISDIYENALFQNISYFLKSGYSFYSQTKGEDEKFIVNFFYQRFQENIRELDELFLERNVNSKEYFSLLTNFEVKDTIIDDSIKGMLEDKVVMNISVLLYVQYSLVIPHYSEVTDDYEHDFLWELEQNCLDKSLTTVWENLEIFPNDFVLYWLREPEKYENSLKEVIQDSMRKFDTSGVCKALYAQIIYESQIESYHTSRSSHFKDIIIVNE